MIDDMAVVGHPTALSTFSYSGKGTDNDLGALSGSMSHPLDSLDLLCTCLVLIFVLCRIILVIALRGEVFDLVPGLIIVCCDRIGFVMRQSGMDWTKHY